MLEFLKQRDDHAIRLADIPRVSPPLRERVDLVEYHHRRHSLDIAKEFTQASGRLPEVRAHDRIKPYDKDRKRHLAPERSGGQRLAATRPPVEQDLRSPQDAGCIQPLA